jgi:hypothetical protein
MVAAVLTAARRFPYGPDKETAMQYLYLIYEDVEAWQKMPKAEAEKVSGEFFAYTESIRKSGHHVGGNAVQPTRTAMTVRVRNGRLTHAGRAAGSGRGQAHHGDLRRCDT